MRFVGICPESMMDAANQFSAVIGMSMDDARTYRSALWTDGKTKFSIATHDADIDLNQVLSSPLVRPDWDVDEIINMLAAEEVLTNIVLQPPIKPNQLLLYAAPADPDTLHSLGLYSVEQG